MPGEAGVPIVFGDAEMIGETAGKFHCGGLRSTLFLCATTCGYLCMRTPATAPVCGSIKAVFLPAHGRCRCVIELRPEGAMLGSGVTVCGAPFGPLWLHFP